MRRKAFGDLGANADPDQDGTSYVFNLRLPGQQQDETGLNYNYFRDYEPGTGRYVESDPIGLDGGISTFGYVGGNPFGATDPEGLASNPWISCGGDGCKIRIDKNHVGPGRHLHWECAGKKGAFGEFGSPSHGGTSGDAPRRIRECAQQNGFSPSVVFDDPTFVCGAGCKKGFDTAIDVTTGAIIIIFSVCLAAVGLGPA